MSDSQRKSVVVIVDDEEMVLKSLSSFLELETDYTVMSFTSPTEAYEYIAGNDVDLSF